MPTYYLRDSASDLGGGADFSVELLDSTTTASSLSPVIAQGATETSYAFSDVGVPNNADWETGTITVEVNVTTADSDAHLDISVSRVNSSGTVQETSSLAGEQNLSAVQVYNFTVPSKDWAAGAAGDRIRINYAFRSSALHGNITPTIETGTVDTEHITVITEGNGEAVVEPTLEVHGPSGASVKHGPGSAGRKGGP